MPKIKENLAASTLSQPVTKAVEIVMPDLETPGKIAVSYTHLTLPTKAAV